jgi:hypothetical protein
LRIVRAVTRALMLLFALLALFPAVVLAFTPPDPNGPGHHFGEYIHNPHLQGLQPSPGPGGGGGGSTGSSGVGNAFGATNSGTTVNHTDLPAFQFQANGLGLPALTAGSLVGKDAVWVVILLASFITANVVFLVIYLSRAGNYLYRVALRLVPATA